MEGYLTLHIVSALLVAATAATNNTDDAVTNIALHKETLLSTLSQYDSSLAVDGNRDQYVANRSCINIEKKGDSWWQVDLGDIYTLFHIRVLLAKDCCEKIVNDADCYKTPSTYTGRTNITVSGRTCQRWDSQYPHEHIDSYYNWLEENYCRTRLELHSFRKWHFYRFGDELGCYTTDPNVTWERCDIEQCEPETIDDLDLKTGTQEKSLEKHSYIDVTDRERHFRDFILPSDTRARYVEFHQDGTTDYFPLCEVEIYGIQDEATNVASQKTAEMSTVYTGHGHGVATKATDGISDQNFFHHSCFHTEDERNPWWRVDLAEIYMIFMLRLYNRMDCCSYRAHDAMIKSGPSLKTMVDVAWVEGQIENIQNVILPINTKARFVEVMLNGSGYFHLCEVEVYGKIVECEVDPCRNGGNCSVLYCDDLYKCRNYTCTCAEGYGGIDCEVCIHNVAVGKQINASSIYYSTWPPSNAVDGGTDQNVMDGATCVSSQSESNPYLIVDLGDEYTITGVKVYKREDCCLDDDHVIELRLMETTWTSYGITEDTAGTISTFDIYPYVSTRYVKLEAQEENPVVLQICEIQVFGICQEEFTLGPSYRPTTEEHPLPLMQMRFSLADKYNDVVQSEASFIYSIRQGLSNQTGYAMQHFQDIQVEKDPFRVLFGLHGTHRTQMREVEEKLYTLNRFGILEIKNGDGQPLAITAGSLKYHEVYEVNTSKGSRTECPSLVAVFIIVIAVAYM